VSHFTRGRKAPGWIKAGDVVLVLLVLAAAGVSMFMVSRANASEKGSLAVIEVNGHEAMRIALGSGQPDRKFLIHGFTGVNTVEVKDGRLRISNADCRDKVCIGMGWIDSPGKTIVCLPHRVVIRVTGKRGGKGKVDTVTE